MSRIINYITKEIIIEDENLTIKQLVEKAVKKGISLENADLSYTNLTGANLREADLSNSNLKGSDLSNSNLRYSNLKGSDLSNSNLRYIDLFSANLEGANLSNSNLKHFKTLWLKRCRVITADLEGSKLLDAIINQDQLDNLAKAQGIKITINKENDNT